jgi:hypothetical protein
MRRWFLVLAVTLAGGACGDRAVGGDEPFDTRCREVCWDVRDTLMSHFGIPEWRVNCEDAKWRDAETCQRRPPRALPDAEDQALAPTVAFTPHGLAATGLPQLMTWSRMEPSDGFES